MKLIYNINKFSLTQRYASHINKALMHVEHDESDRKQSQMGNREVAHKYLYLGKAKVLNNILNIRYQKIWCLWTRDANVAIFEQTLKKKTGNFDKQTIHHIKCVIMKNVIQFETCRCLLFMYVWAHFCLDSKFIHCFISIKIQVLFYLDELNSKQLDEGCLVPRVS